MRRMKKVLTATLAAAMVMASVTTAFATTSSTDSGASSSEEATTEETTTEESTSESSSSDESTTLTYAEEKSVSADAAVSVAGTSVKTTVAGVYAAQTVRGTVITAATADIKAALGLTGSQKPYVIIYDTDAKKSNLAMNCVNATAEAIGADVVASLNIDLGAKENGQWVELTNGSVGMTAGLPADADTSKTYSVVCVQPGGVITILEDEDVNPNTVTFALQAGLGTYAIVAQ